MEIHKFKFVSVTDYVGMQMLLVSWTQITPSIYFFGMGALIIISQKIMAQMHALSTAITMRKDNSLINGG